MKGVGKIARLTLGLLLVIFGLNGLTGFMGERILPPEAMEAIAMIDGLAFARPFLAILAILTGIMLLLDLMVPVAASLSLVLLIPILFYHLMFHPKGSMFAFLGLLALIFVIWDYRDMFRQVLRRGDKKVEKGEE